MVDYFTYRRKRLIMELSDLEHGMGVAYQTGHRPNGSRKIRWSEVKSCELYVVRREIDLPKRHRSWSGWKAGSLLIVAASDSAEFSGEDYTEFGYFYNGEEDFLRIVGLGDDAFEKDRNADITVDAVMEQMSKVFGGMGIRGVQIGGRTIEIPGDDQ